MAKWIRVGNAEEYPPGEKKCLEVDGIRLVVCNVEGQIVSIANICPHAHLPLGDGELHGGVLICPYHGYAYSVLTGKNADYPLEEQPVDCYPVRLTEDGEVEVEVPDEQ